MSDNNVGAVKLLSLALTLDCHSLNFNSTDISISAGVDGFSLLTPSAVSVVCVFWLRVVKIKQRVGLRHHQTAVLEVVERFYSLTTRL